MAGKVEYSPLASGPASTAASSLPTVTKLPDDVSPEVRALIATVQRYKSATTWEEIDEATRALDADAVYDSPFMYISGGRDRVRAVAKLLAPFAYTEFTPRLVHILMHSAERKAQLDVDGTLTVIPRRHWWLPLSWFAPELPIQGTVSLTVKSWNDKVARVQERFANIPTAIPFIIRWLTGWGVGTFGAIAEPVLAQLAEWYSTGYSTVQGGVEQVSAHPAVASAASRLEDLKGSVASGVDAVKGKVAGVVPGVVSE
ncbi:hypothetical protein HYH03_000281 [Edaphochlamys debaryana]|uniref:Uncharacterized protein n=1 Tax=Edaphochlamys debaryana TaxID=47281 RepID=A0A835YFV0_9CHLO|nr:hypothetical protein HYH03_000281 [Edaphochlamys debaryana]|eukprot:KAG2501781.1 hypothetical protein HYH03_000281 [Edaphochlamys debaryana]